MLLKRGADREIVLDVRLLSWYTQHVVNLLSKKGNKEIATMFLVGCVDPYVKAPEQKPVCDWADLGGRSRVYIIPDNILRLRMEFILRMIAGTPDGTGASESNPQVLPFPGRALKDGYPGPLLFARDEMESSQTRLMFPSLYQQAEPTSGQLW